MRAGRRDRRIQIQRRTDTRDDHGQPIPTWTTIGAIRWTSYSPVEGAERFVADQFVAREQVEFRVLWANDLDGLNPKDRVVYPTVSSGTVPDSQIYEIMAVHEIGRREGLSIITARRSET